MYVDVYIIYMYFIIYIRKMTHVKLYVWIEYCEEHQTHFGVDFSSMNVLIDIGEGLPTPIEYSPYEIDCNNTTAIVDAVANSDSVTIYWRTDESIELFLSHLSEMMGGSLDMTTISWHGASAVVDWLLLCDTAHSRMTAYKLTSTYDAWVTQGANAFNSLQILREWVKTLCTPL